MFEDILFIIIWRGVLLVSSGERPGILLNILPCTRQLLAALGVTNVLIVLRLKNPALWGSSCSVIILSKPTGNFIQLLYHPPLILQMPLSLLDLTIQITKYLALPHWPATLPFLSWAPFKTGSFMGYSGNGAKQHFKIWFILFPDFKEVHIGPCFFLSGGGGLIHGSLSFILKRISWHTLVLHL